MHANPRFDPDHASDPMWADLDASMSWGPPTERTSLQGRTYLAREAPASDAFWAAWRTCKDCVKAAGYFVAKSDAGKYVVSKLARLVRAQDAPAAGTPLEGGRVSAPVGNTTARPAGNYGSLPSGNPSLRIPLPPDKALLPFQAEDVRRMVAMRSALLASDMGTGKTPQMIAVGNAVGAGRVLIVCPARVVGNWQAELEAWSTMPGEPLVLSYEAATRRAAELRARDWELVCFDEAHYLASHDSQRAHALLGDGGIRAAFRILASGSPIPNKVHGMWPLLEYLQPGEWGTAHEFGVRYGAGYFDRDAGPQGAWVYKGSSNLPELNARLRGSVMIRRTKAEVLSHLPPKRHKLVRLRPTEEQVRLVEDERRLANVDPDRIANGLGEVRLEDGSNLASVRAELATTKFDAVVRYAQDLVDQGEKVVIFGHHRHLLERLARYWGRAAVAIVGGQSQEATTKAVRLFQTDHRVMVCVVSIRAGSAGLTLTAASHAVFAEADWSAAVMDQAADRIHRIGQTRECTYHHLAIEGSVDALLYMVGSRKRKTAQSALA